MLDDPTVRDTSSSLPAGSSLGADIGRWARCRRHKGALAAVYGDIRRAHRSVRARAATPGAMRSWSSNAKELQGRQAFRA